MAARDHTAVSVRVGVRRPSTQQTAIPRMVILAVGPRTRAWLSDAYPAAVVRKPERSASGTVVEHLRFGHKQALTGLPGLGARFPSLVRDSVGLALSAGASSVDLLLARAPRALPWDVHRPEILDVFHAPLMRLPGTLVTVPDVVGPALQADHPARDPEAIGQRLVQVARQLDPVLREAWQVGLLDCPPGVARPALLSRLAGSDISLWTWSGSGPAMARHGWRSAAAAMAGLLSRRKDVVFHGKSRQKLSPGPGRSIRRLTGGPAAQPPPTEPVLNALLLDRTGDSAVVSSETTLRSPIGQWDVATLRTVKLIHRRIRLAADEFVFRPVTSSESLALAAALDIVLRPFVQAGLLAGPGGQGTPNIRGYAQRDQNAPSLVAEVGATVRPWARKLDVRVGVDPGRSATVEVRT
jgi:hypothetical protein